MEKKKARPTEAATPVHSCFQRKKIPRLLRSPQALKARFADLPADLLLRLAAPFDIPTLWAASMACQSWREALRPLREAMVLLRLGKWYKHGRGRGRGISRPNPRRALEYFLKGADRGSAAAMVDAGLMYWEMGRKGEAQALYNRAAELGHPVGQCHLGVCYLEADQPNPEEAVRWFYQAAQAGYARAQYNLALCLHKGRGLKINMEIAAKWYLRAAEGGYVRAMYNTSLCYSTGEGLVQNLRHARQWMKRAAKGGHGKAQFEHGLQLYSSGHMVEALVYLELAIRAGVDDATYMRDIVLQSLSQTSRVRARCLVESWLPS